jgi:hypothetical protein
VELGRGQPCAVSERAKGETVQLYDFLKKEERYAMANKKFVSAAVFLVAVGPMATGASAITAELAAWAALASIAFATWFSLVPRPKIGDPNLQLPSAALQTARWSPRKPVEGVEWQ